MQRIETRTTLALAGLLVLFLTMPAAGEQLTLAGAISLARQNAPEIAAAESRILAGEARLEQARSYRMPSISLQEIWMRTDSPAEAFALELNQERFSFPAFVSSDPNDPDPIESATTRLQASMPIYTGGEISGRIQQADLAAQAAGSTAAWAGNNAALAAAEAYVRLAQAREYVALMERALETVTVHVETAAAYTEQGMLVRSELLRAEVEQARIEDLLTEANGQARIAAANLSFRLGVEPDNGWELAALPSPPARNEDLGTWLATASTRPDLAAARQMLAAGDLEARIQRSGMKPKIGLLARHDLTDDSPFGTHGDSTAIMAVANLDLWNGGRHKAAARAADAEVQAGRREIEQFSDAIALQVKHAFEQETSALERHATALRAQEAAAEAERITTQRFAQGVVKTIDVLDASTARREAEMRELMARTEAHLARFRLAVQAGRQPEDVSPDGEIQTPGNTSDEDQ